MFYVILPVPHKRFITQIFDKPNNFCPDKEASEFGSVVNSFIISTRSENNDILIAVLAS